jgi:hypothetical protein
MEWFFATTEGFLPGTSIMVGRNGYPSGGDFEASCLPLESWQMQRLGCTMQ